MLETYLRGVARSGKEGAWREFARHVDIEERESVTYKHVLLVDRLNHREFLAECLIFRRLSTIPVFSAKRPVMKFKFVTKVRNDRLLREEAVAPALTPMRSQKLHGWATPA